MSNLGIPYYDEVDEAARKAQYKLFKYLTKHSFYKECFYLFPESIQRNCRQFEFWIHVGKGEESNVREFLEKGLVNVNHLIAVKKKSVPTPLHLAVYVDRLRIVKLLLQYGADTRIVNKDGQNAIDMARRLGYKRRKALKLLKQYGKKYFVFNSI